MTFQKMFLTFLFYFFQTIGFDISSKLSVKELGTICMKCQTFVSLGDTLRDIPNPVFWKNKNKQKYHQSDISWLSPDKGYVNVKLLQANLDAFTVNEMNFFRGKGTWDEYDIEHERTFFFHMWACIRNNASTSMETGQCFSCCYIINKM